jgi:hypothetical protein
MFALVCCTVSVTFAGAILTMTRLERDFKKQCASLRAELRA